MDDEMVCSTCNLKFNDDDGELHPTLDGIYCPRCGAVNLYAPDFSSAEDFAEAALDALWERHHCSEDDRFYA